MSLPAIEFDGDAPGQFSDEKSEPQIGRVLGVSNGGIANVRCLEDKLESKVRTNKLKLEVRKPTIARIIVLSVEGAQVALESSDKGAWPKDFFEHMVKKDWGKWAEAIKKELEGRMGLQQCSVGGRYTRGAQN